mmetsp:Transcript_25369/g.73200  ORF Transcript_25369/g.73200 Transcript_25369/m.73200 type:complete len:269 (+) Transcript_25369:841-1647(+)
MPLSLRVTLMLLLFTSPWTMQGSMPCKCCSAQPTSVSTFISASSCVPSSGFACMPWTKTSRLSPSTRSQIVASSPLSGSMVAPRKGTMFGCRTRRRSRISLHNVAVSFGLKRARSGRGSLMAAGVPRKRPIMTMPKPPSPHTTTGRKMWISDELTSQCSRTPISAMCSKPARIEGSAMSGLCAQTRSMSRKTHSVSGLEVALLTRPNSDATVFTSSSGAKTASSAMVPRSSTSRTSVFGTSSTWLTPSNTSVSGPLTATTANCTRSVA